MDGNGDLEMRTVSNHVIKWGAFFICEANSYQNCKATGKFVIGGV